MNRAIALLLGLAVLFSGSAAAQTWESLQGPQVASTVRDISVTKSGTHVFVADGSYLLKSTNSGQGYAVTPVPYTAPLVALVKPDDSSKVVVAKNGELRYNDQGGAGGIWDRMIEDPTLVPLRLSAAVNDPTVMLLGRTWVSGDRSIWRSSDGGNGWSKVDGFTSATAIHDFAPYPDSTSGHAAGLVWAAGSSDATPPPSFDRNATAEIRGLWISADYGANWPYNKLGGYNVKSVAIVSRTSPTMYHVYAAVSAAGRDSLMKLTDHNSNNWTPVFSGADEIRMVRVNDSTKSIFLATNDGVYRSTNAYGTNGGGNWSKMTGLPENDVRSIAVGSDSTVYAGTSGSLYRSTDNGATWTNVGDMDVSSAEPAFTGTSQKAWAVTRGNNITARYEQGSGWTASTVGTAGAAWSLEHAYRNPHNGTLVVAGAKQGAARLATSGNEGVSYSEPSVQPVFTSGRYRGSVAHPTVSGWMYAFGGGATANGWRNFVLSSDGGGSWTAATGPIPGAGQLEVYDLVATGTTPVVMFAALSDGTVYRSGNGGVTWSFSVDAGSTARTLAVNPASADTVYAGGDDGLWRTSNDGGSWMRIRTDPVVDVLIHPSWGANRERIWVVAGGRIYSTTNAGGSWTDVTGALSGKTITGLRGDVVHKGYIYASTTDGVFRVNEPPAITGFAGSIVGGHPSLSWTANEELDLENYEVWRYHQTCSYYCPNIKGCTDVDAPALIASPTGTGFTDNSEQVTPCPGINGIAGVVAYYAKAVDNDGARTTSGHVKFRQATGDPLKQGDSGGEIPEGYSLGGAYPNPFNPATSFTYGLPEAGEVSLVVYDLLGRRVAVLVSEKLEAGYHRAEWMGTSDAGTPVASGVYVARLAVTSGLGTTKFITTTKLALMK